MYGANPMFWPSQSNTLVVPSFQRVHFQVAVQLAFLSPWGIWIQCWPLDHLHWFALMGNSEWSMLAWGVGESSGTMECQRFYIFNTLHRCCSYLNRSRYEASSYSFISSHIWHTGIFLWLVSWEMSATIGMMSEANVDHCRIALQL